MVVGSNDAQTSLALSSFSSNRKASKVSVVGSLISSEKGKECVDCFDGEDDEFGRFAPSWEDDMYEDDVENFDVDAEECKQIISDENRMFQLPPGEEYSRIADNNTVHRLGLLANYGVNVSGIVVEKAFDVYRENLIIYNYQKSYLTELRVDSNDKLCNVRKVSSDETKTRFWEDSIELYAYATNNHLSEAKFSELLVMTGNILRRGESISELPYTGKSVRTACEKNMKTLYPTSSLIIDLPIKIFGDKNLLNKTLRHVEAEYYPLETVLGRELLNVNIENFAFKPEVVIDADSNERLFGHFSSGTYYEELDGAARASIKARWPNMLDDDILILAISIFSDSTQVNKLNSKSCNALLFQIENICGLDKIPSLIGFLPECLGDSKLTLMAILCRRGFNSVALRTRIIKYFIRANKLAFVAKALEQILIWQDSGVKVMVGGGPSNPKEVKEKTAFIYLSSIMGDAQELDMYAGTSLKSAKRPCRICLAKDVVTCVPGCSLGVIRSDISHNEICTQSGLRQVEYWEAIGTGRTKKFVKDLLAASRVCMDEAVAHGLNPAFNPMYPFYYFQVSKLLFSLFWFLLYFYLILRVFFFLSLFH